MKTGDSERNLGFESLTLRTKKRIPGGYPLLCCKNVLQKTFLGGIAPDIYFNQSLGSISPDTDVIPSQIGGRTGMVGNNLNLVTDF